MKHRKYILAMALLSVSLVGCNAVRQAVKTVDHGIGVIGAVKDDAFGAVNTLIDVSENVKTNITQGATATANTATK